jgi:hypothetical protein
MKSAPMLALIFLALIFASATLVAQPRFAIPLTVTDGSSVVQVFFGVLPSANYCIDIGDSIDGHREFFDVGPHPPSGNLEVHFGWPRAGNNAACFDLGSPCDFRPFTSDNQRDTFKVNIWSQARLPVTISWPSGLSRYFQSLTLKDVVSNGLHYTVDMLEQTTVSLYLREPGVRIFGDGLRSPNDTTVDVDVRLNAGWNLISNPFRPAIPGDSVRQLFPTSVNAYAFGYSRGYVQSYRLIHGKGYWLKFPSGGIQTIRGVGHSPDTISVPGGWNIIGAPYFPIPKDSVQTVPPNIIEWSRFFGFEGGYQQDDTLRPGRGYLVRIIGGGMIIYRRPN